MKTRLITAAIGVLVFFALLFAGEQVPIVLCIAISLANAMICGEFLTAKKQHREYGISVPCVLFSFLVPFLSFFGFHLIALYVYIVLFAVTAVIWHEKITVNDVMFSFGGVLLISACMTMFSMRVCSDRSYVAFWLVITVGVPWLADSFAYFTGIAIGKHKLCPKISPKKTIEGAVGGIIGGIAGSLAIGWVFSMIYHDVSINYIVLGVVGVVNSVVSIFGDLFFSVIKRECGIKDYGSIMPGHGGLLDRFDSVIFCIPLIYLLSQYVPFITYVGV